MSEVVVVTTYKRDELLALCLEAIRHEDADIPIIVSSDRGWTSDDLVSVCRQYKTHLRIIMASKGYGNSYNVIQAMGQGLLTGANILHFIEDDTILHGGYLAWARTVLARPQFACALGRIPGDTVSTWYESPCVSWKAECLQESLRKVPLGYFAPTREEMGKIVDAAFPHSKYRYGSAEQDGFFLRCLEFFKWKTAYPELAMASHIGAWGYNRDSHKPPTGNFEQRVEWCRKLLHDKEQRTALFGDRITKSEMEGLNA